MRRIYLAFLLGGAAGTASAAPNWYYEFKSATLVDLGTLGEDTSSVAYDINDYGRIVGDSVNGGTSRAFIYSPVDGMESVFLGFHASRSYARGINNNDEFVGYLHWSQDPSYVDRGWYAQMGSNGVHLKSNPQAPFPYNWSMRAYAINDNGAIVGGGAIDYASGSAQIPNVGGDCYSYLPVRWANANAQAAMVFCPVDASNNFESIAYDINNTDVVVGIDNGTTTLKMFRSNYASLTAQSIPEPSNPSVPNPQGYKWGKAFGVSNTGRVTGFFSVNGIFRAFYWNGTSTSSYDLGVMPGGNISMGREVNDQGFVAGYSEFLWSSPFNGSTSIRKAAFIWGSDIGMIKLPTFTSQPLNFAWSNCEANALNNRAESSGLIQVVGYCQKGGQNHAVLWNVTVAKKYVAPPLQ